MNSYLFFSLIVLSFVLMEGLTWLIHKYIMHGFLWILHKDHHNPLGSKVEKNDLFILIFAIPSWLCIMQGLQYKNYNIAAIGFGIALYGVAYFFFHEIIIHQRLKLFSKINSKYIRAIRLAHRMHHKHLSKCKGESFGMLIVAKKYWKK